MRGSSARAFAIGAALAVLVSACSTTGVTGGGPAATATGNDTGKNFVFASTQFSPVLEQEAMRQKILAEWKGAGVEFVTDQEPVIIDRITVESKAGGTGQIGIAGLENGQFSSLVTNGYLMDLAKTVERNKARNINADMLTLGKAGSATQVYIPWMQQTYFLAANKKALQYLPSGADVNTLTYDQLIAWAKNIFEKTGQKRFGWPVGTSGPEASSRASRARRQWRCGGRSRSCGSIRTRSRPHMHSCKSRCSRKRSGSPWTTALASSTS